MSKIGKKPISIPAWVDVMINNNMVTIKGPKWELSQKFLDCVKIIKEENEVVLSIQNDDDRKFRGLSRTLIANMIEGVINWFEKKLLIIWVWYWAQLQWNKLVLSIGLSHKVDYNLPKGIESKTEQDPKWNTIVTITGIDKQLVWEVSAKLRSYKSPEPYKGKGIRYIDEFIKLKPGKSAGK